jgi:hypothetical protein
MDEEGREQVYCAIGNEGHVWISHSDRLPSKIRQQLAQSPFNICPACLVCFMEPRVRSLRPDWPREKLLCMGIKVMEEQIRLHDTNKTKSSVWRA